MDDFEYEPLYDYTNHMYQHVISRHPTDVFISAGGEDPRRVAVHKLYIMAKSKLLTLRLSQIEDQGTSTLDFLTFEHISFLVQNYLCRPVPVIPEQILRKHAETFQTK